MCLLMESSLLPVFSSMALMLTFNLQLSCCWMIVDRIGTSSVIAAVTKQDEEGDGDLCILNEDKDDDFLMLHMEWEADLCTTFKAVTTLS